MSCLGGASAVRPELWAADHRSGWAEPDVVAQLAWLAQIHQMKEVRRVDAADVAAGPALRAAGCRYGYRDVGDVRWTPIKEADRFIPAVSEGPGGDGRPGVAGHGGWEG